MVTNQTQLYCTDSHGTTLKNGGIYTFDKTAEKQGFYFISLKEYEGKWFAIHRFEIIDHVDISQLTQILEN